MNIGDPLTAANLVDVAEIIRIADAIDAATDAKQWDEATAFFHEAVATDFTSLGGEAKTMSGAELTAMWAANLGPAKTSCHLRTNHRVHIAGDTARLDTHGYAWNRLEGNGEPLWEVWGTYVHNLIRTGGRWRVSGLAFTVSHERGNPWVKATPG